MSLSIFVKLCISLFIPFALGYSVRTNLVRAKSPFLLNCAISYGLGAGILSLWMLILGMFNIPFSFNIIAFPILLLTGFFIYLALAKSQSRLYPLESFLSSENNEQNPSSGQKLFYFLSGFYILLLMIFVFYLSLFQPVGHWDAVATVVFKAKVFFYDRTIHQLNLPHQAYPLLIPFFQCWIALTLNTWSDFLIKIVHPLALLNYGIIQYYYLKSVSSRSFALLGLCFLLSSSFVLFHATIAYRDLFLMYYNCTTIILILLWQRKLSKDLLILASLFAGFATFTKLEGTGYLFVHTSLVLVILFKDKMLSMKEKYEYLFIFVIPSYIICFSYHFYKYVLGVSSLAGRTKITIDLSLVERLKLIFLEYFNHMFLTGNWHLIWALVIIALIMNFNKIKSHKETQLVGIALLLFFALLTAISLFTKSFISLAGVESITVLSRILLHFFPLSILFIILLISPSQTDPDPKY